MIDALEARTEMRAEIPGKMTRRFFVISLAVLSVLGVLAALLHVTRLDALAVQWLQMRANAEQRQDGAIWLTDYTVVIEAQTIPGIENDISGLTYNPATRSLFTVLNGAPQIVELSLQGEVLRRITVGNVDDMEGITFIGGDRYAIVEEGTQAIYLVRIGPGTRQLDTQTAPRLALAIDLKGNKGFEGISYDERTQRLLVVKESDPLRVFAITGFVDAANVPALRLDIREIEATHSSRLFMLDLSSLTIHDATGHLLLLSHESMLVAEYAADGSPVSMMLLWPGLHGLHHRVPQAEGIALDNEDNIYLVSEPNLFYKFSRRRASN